MKLLSCAHIAAVTPEFGIPHRGFDYLSGNHNLGVPASLSSGGPTAHNPKANRILEALCKDYPVTQETLDSAKSGGFNPPSTNLLLSSAKANKHHAAWLRENHLSIAQTQTATEAARVHQLLEQRSQRFDAAAWNSLISHLFVTSIPIGIDTAIAAIKNVNPLSLKVTAAYLAGAGATFAFSGKDPVSKLGSKQSLGELRDNVLKLKRQEDEYANRVQDMDTIRKNTSSSTKEPPPVDVLLARELDEIRHKRNKAESEYIDNLGYQLHAAKEELDWEQKFATNITPQRQQFLDSKIENLSKELADALLRK